MKIQKHRNADPVKVEIEIPQPVVVQNYYTANGMIDSHKRCRSDDLMVERKIKVHNWDQRLNLTIFSICVVDQISHLTLYRMVTLFYRYFFYKLPKKMNTLVCIF